MKHLINTLFFIFITLPMLAFAQTPATIDSPDIARPISELVYTVKPDLRKCAFPMCGGYWLTPVNRITLAIPDEYEAESPYVEPTPIYVTAINYKGVGLSDDEIQKFQYYIGNGRALIKGYLGPYSWSSSIGSTQYRQLNATTTWTSANTNSPVGPYLEVKSSGIVCITTPCPYYSAQQINTYFSFLFDELNFDRALLTDRQLEIAWKLVANRSLVLTGTRYSTQGTAARGAGIAANQVFFPFPLKY